MTHIVIEDALTLALSRREKGADELFAVFELGEDHRAGGGVEAEDGEFVNRTQRFRPENFIRRAGCGDGAVVEKDQVVGEGGAEIDVVGGEDGRDLLLFGELAEQF